MNHPSPAVDAAETPGDAGRQGGDPRRGRLPSVSEPVTHEKELTATVKATASVAGGVTVVRGLNDFRLAVLGILVTVGLAAAAIPDAWSTQLAAGLGSFAFACLLVRWRRSRHYLMSFVYWLTGQ